MHTLNARYVEMEIWGEVLAILRFFGTMSGRGCYDDWQIRETLRKKEE